MFEHQPTESVFLLINEATITSRRDMDLPLGLNGEQQVLLSSSYVKSSPTQTEALCLKPVSVIQRRKQNISKCPAGIRASGHDCCVCSVFSRLSWLWLTSEVAVSSDGFTNTTVSRTSLWYWRIRWPTGNRNKAHDFTEGQIMTILNTIWRNSSTFQGTAEADSWQSIQYWLRYFSLN